jgi:hypothetical protein
MGSRDDKFLDDERADAALLRLLARSGQPSHAPHPPDLVTRTLRLLPPEMPAIAARKAARRAVAGLALRCVLAGALLLIALLGIWSAFGGGAQLAMLFGNGAQGISRTLLMLELLAKPLLRTVAAAGGVWLLAAIVVIGGAGWLGLRLLLRTPVYYVERAS